MEAFERVRDRWIRYPERKLAEDAPDEIWAIADGFPYMRSKEAQR